MPGFELGPKAPQALMLTTTLHRPLKDCYIFDITTLFGAMLTET